MSPEEKAIEAYKSDELSELLMGIGAYYEREAYMAPSTVPTNWDVILEGLKSAAKRFSDLPQKVERAMRDMSTSAEGFYCALETLISYLYGQGRLAPDLVLDALQVADDLRTNLLTIESEARTLRPSWMGRTAETLWDRIERATKILNDEFGIDIRNVAPSP
jgi:hypothetical protein